MKAGPFVNGPELYSTMIIEPLSPTARSQVLILYTRNPQYHVHLDWRTLSQLLAYQNLRCWLAKDGTEIVALLAANIHAANTGEAVAWLRLMFTKTLKHEPILDHLWEKLYVDLQTAGVKQIAALEMKEWVASVYQAWNFEETNAIVTLQREHSHLPPQSPDADQIFPASRGQLAEITHIDTASFDPLWRYSQDTLTLAFSQAATTTILFQNDQPAGYQLSTQHSKVGHLARLAVLPDMQGKGLGSSLVIDMLHFFAKRGVTNITVNTQLDNRPSQRVYHQLDFKSFGPYVPVWTHDVQSQNG